MFSMSGSAVRQAKPSAPEHGLPACAQDIPDVPCNKSPCGRVFDPPFAVSQVHYVDRLAPLDAFQAMGMKFSGVIKGKATGFCRRG